MTRSNRGSRASTAGGVAAAVLIWAAFALIPASASAEGGTSIASAPVVTYGQQQFGNTATGQHLEDVCFEDEWLSYWNVNVLAGDLLTINWESVADGTQVKLMPVGTTDFTVFHTNEALEQSLSSNNKNQFTYQVPVSGLMPLYFAVCGYSVNSAGPYAFTANVQHAVFASLTPLLHMRPTGKVSGSATLADGIPVPDGTIFNLVAKWHSHHKVLRATTSAATAGGALAFQLNLPPETAGKVVRLSIARGEDGAYQATRSAPVNVKIARKAPRRHRHHRHKRRHHR